MPQDIFYRAGCPTPPGGSGGVGYSVRSNGYASIGVGGGGPDSPFIATGGGSGRPATILNYVKVTLEGEAGSLTRVEAQVTAYDAGTFDGLIGGPLQVGKDIAVTIGRSGPGAGAGQTWNVTIYKHGFQSSKDGKWTLTITAVGKGLELMKRNGIGLPASAKGKNFKKFANVLGFPWVEDVPVTGLIDYMMWEALDATVGKFPVTVNVESGTGVPGKFVQYILPTGVKPTMPESGVGPSNRNVYFTLDWLLKLINDNLPAKSGKLKWDKALVDMSVDGLPLISGDPMNVLIPRGDGQSDYVPSGVTVSLSSLISALQGLPNGIFTSAAQVTQMAGGNAKCGNILLSYFCLKGIENSLSTKPETDQTEGAFDPNQVKLDLEGFLGSVFSVIREATGGWIDLITMEDPKAFDNGRGPDPADIWVVNRKHANSGAGPTMFDDISGEGGVREATFSGDVPQGWQAEAFAKGSVVGDGQGEDKAAKITSWTEAKAALAKAGFDASQAAGIKSGLRSKIDGMTPSVTSQKYNRPYPIGLSLKVNGVTGIGFGHAIEMQSLQATRWKGNTAFTVTRVIHNVQGQDWTTDIETVARLVPG